MLANVLQSMANQVQTALTLGCLTISFEPNFTRLFSLPYSDGFYRISNLSVSVSPWREFWGRHGRFQVTTKPARIRILWNFVYR